MLHSLLQPLLILADHVAFLSGVMSVSLHKYPGEHTLGKLFGKFFERRLFLKIYIGNNEVYESLMPLG